MPSDTPMDHSPTLARWAWIPVPVLLLTILALWAWGPAGSYPARTVAFAGQIVFMTLASLVTAYFLVRSFLAEGSAGLLPVGGGIVVWGLSGVLASAFGSADANQAVTIHNLSVWLAAASQLCGVLLAARRQRLQQRAAWALATVAAVTALVTLVAVAATGGWTPTFFVPGQGGTLVRQSLLASACVMFVLSAIVLSGREGRAASPFADWYRLGLLLMAVGLLGVMVQSARGSVVGWVGIGTQWLGGVYLVLASMAAARESKAAHISLAVAPRDALLRYGLAVVFVAAAWSIRLLFFPGLGDTVPYILFFPAVMLAALYGGAGPGVLAATLSMVIATYLWIRPGGALGIENPAHWIAAALFYADCILLILVARAMQRAQERAVAAEAERRFAQRAEQALRDADQRKDAFLATLSHEIRNALAPISNSLEIIDRASDTGQTQNARGLVRQQVAHLNRIVDDLLDISRITRDKLELRKAPADLATIIRLSVEASQPLADRAGHRIDVTLPDTPVHVDADSMRLAQVFINLLNNACKYTEGQGRIELRVTRSDPVVRICVKDNGIGIAPEMLARIFEPFTQVDASLARSQGGLGIGLSLARRLVEMHGGTLTASSDGLGKGSEFVVELPALAQAPAPAAPARAARSVAPAAVAARRILVADDNRDSADSFAQLFALEGNQVATAYDGLEAFVAAQRFRPHVALLDVGMPKLDGYEVCRRIRQEDWGKEMVLIAHTGWGEVPRVSEAGFDAHLTKPVDYAALINLLENLSNRTRA